MSEDRKDDGFGTRCIHAGQSPDPATGAIMTPVYMTSTYVQEAPCVHKGYDYSRTANPTRAALEGNLAGLENAQWGLAFSSGMGAANTVLNLLKSGDHVVSGNDIYGGTYRLFRQVWEQLGLTFTFVDPTDLSEIEGALKDYTKLLWLETPSNPLLRVTDIRGAARLAAKVGARTVVDNTFATPALQEPMALGADIILHSTTKYIGGHSDVVGGALCGNDPETLERLKFFQNSVGAVPGPMDAFLTLRGTKTLHLRMERHCANGRAVAAYLSEHPRVAKVHYPGLESHQGHDVAKRQMKDFGGMVSFELDMPYEQAMKVASSFRLFALAESLGGVESLLDHPASMTHASIPAEERKAAGLEDGLLRLSVGVEDIDDLLADLEQGIASV
ncbi:MAG: cystathionine gamma-synthase [Planctomycetota bacterium]|jgi:cystathionine gamma-lyase